MIKMDDLDHVVYILILVASLILGMMIGGIIESGSKFCPVCGEEYLESVSYCKYDGTELMMKGKH